jgi:hypothetical protein
MGVVQGSIPCKSIFLLFDGGWVSCCSLNRCAAWGLVRAGFDTERPTNTPNWPFATREQLYNSTLE